MSTPRDRTAWFKGGNACCSARPNPAGRPYHLVLLGPPGVGKGTQAELLCERLGTCHLPTGDVFRAARCDADPSPALRDALEHMKRGELVPDALVVSLVGERSGCLGCLGGFLLDGFPRTVAQAEALDQMLARRGVGLDGVICYELPIDEIVDRLSGRRTCAGCKAVYHVSARPSRVAGVCDACGGELVQREDDRPESVRVRMAAYEESTRPLAEYYERKGKLVAVEASGSPEQILERTLQSLSKQTAGVPA